MDSTPTPEVFPTPTWTVFEIFQKAWDGIKNNLAFTAALSLVLGFGIWVFNLIPVIGVFFAAPLAAGYLHCLLQIRQGEVVKPIDFLWGFLDTNRLLNLVLLQILISIGTCVGTILLLVPGLWFFVASSLANAEFVLHGGDAVNAIKRSFLIVKGHWWKYAGLLAAVGVLNFVGALFFIIGILITAPISVLALVIAVEAAGRDARPSPRS